MTTFRLTLKNDKHRQYDRIAVLIIVLHLLLFTYAAIYAPVLNMQIFAWAGALICLVILVAGFFFIRASATASRIKVIGIICCAITWLLLQQWWMAAAGVLLLILYRFAKRDLNVFVNETHITYPSFPVKDIRWNDLNNIILKDGLLTIDFKNNRIIQQLIEKDGVGIDERDFNDFCRKRLVVA